MDIQVWSDLVCTWCDLGKRLDQTAALAYLNSDAGST